MAETILLPRQGNSVESCIILEWKKQEGDSVSEGETVCEVETDKATFEVEATASGVLRKQLVAEGDDVPVLAPIAIVGEADEDISSLVSEDVADSGEKSSTETEPATGTSSSGESAGVPTDEKVTAGAADEGVTPPASAHSAAPGETRKSADAAVGISPRARMRAQEVGIDAKGVVGSGPGGRVIERDVLAAAESRGPVTSAAKQVLRAAGGRMSVAQAEAMRDSTSVGSGESEGRPADVTEFPGAYEDTPVRSVRKVIAERMHSSLQETAQLTLNRRADARALLSFRKRLKGSSDESLQGISINDLILYAVSRALREYPEMNSHFLGDTIRTFSAVHLGFAVDTDRGLMVPTITNADGRSLKELSKEAKRVAKLAVDGKAGSEELREGTFTVTNLGALGIDYFTPVLNPPQVGILGVGGITPGPLSIEDPDSLIPKIALSLTIDHQGVDGAPGARFLGRIAEMLSEIELVLAQ